eukprot:159332-Chlamydomonas_euryale.AAC.1
MSLGEAVRARVKTNIMGRTCHAPSDTTLLNSLISASHVATSSSCSWTCATCGGDGFLCGGRSKRGAVIGAYSGLGFMGLKTPVVGATEAWVLFDGGGGGGGGVHGCGTGSGIVGGGDGVGRGVGGVGAVVDTRVFIGSMVTFERGPRGERSGAKKENNWTESVGGQMGQRLDGRWAGGG